MSSPWRELGRWLRRAQPPTRSLVKALGAGSLAAATGLALFIGAPYLLVFSTAHHQLVSGSTLAILLILIELLAFLRSPLRYVERLSTHDLGLQSVTAWRRWLTMTVGSWPYRRWVDAATSDLLERALHDTDTLQDLWLRSIVPLSSVAVALALGDVVVIVLPGPTATAAAALMVGQLLLIVAAASQLARLVAAERDVRRARSSRTAARVEAQSIAPELELLGRADLLARRLADTSAEVATREARRDARGRLLQVIGALGPVLSLVLVWVTGSLNALGSGAQVIIVLVALGSSELGVAARQGVAVAVAVTAASERLDALTHVVPFGHEPWPGHLMIDVESLNWTYGNHHVMSELTWTVAPGRRVALTGPTGSGKSTLLRLLARLEEIPDGVVSVGGVDINSVDDVAWRRHVAYVDAAPALLSGVVDRVIRVGRVTTDDVAVALGELGLVATSTTRWEQLSRGETQRAALVRGLLDEPKLVLLDEPTSALGDLERRRVLARLDRLDATVIIATHDQAVMDWCDECFEVRDGRLVLLSR